MYNILFSLAVFPLSIGLAQPKEQVVVPVVVKTEQQQILESINSLAVQFNINRDELYSVLKCESNLSPNRKGDFKNGVYLANNIGQYHKRTFESHAKMLGEELDYESWSDQLKAMAYAFSIGEADAWTAHRAIKNGGTYSFYSKLLDKNFTVSCPLLKYPVK